MLIGERVRICCAVIDVPSWEKDKQLWASAHNHDCPVATEHLNSVFSSLWRARTYADKGKWCHALASLDASILTHRIFAREGLPLVAQCLAQTGRADEAEPFAARLSAWDACSASVDAGQWQQAWDLTQAHDIWLDHATLGLPQRAGPYWRKVPGLRQALAGARHFFALKLSEAAQLPPLEQTLRLVAHSTAALVESCPVEEEAWHLAVASCPNLDGLHPDTFFRLAQQHADRQVRQRV